MQAGLQLSFACNKFVLSCVKANIRLDFLKHLSKLVRKLTPVLHKGLSGEQDSGHSRGEIPTCSH